MRSLNDKLLYEVMTSFTSDIFVAIFVASTERMFDNTTIANIRSSVNHKIENSLSVYDVSGSDFRIYHDMKNERTVCAGI